MVPMTSSHEDQDTPVGRPEPIISHERPLTPAEMADLGIEPGTGFADQLKEVLSKAPDTVFLGTVRDHA